MSETEPFNIRKGTWKSRFLQHEVWWSEKKWQSLGAWQIGRFLDPPPRPPKSESAFNKILRWSSPWGSLVHSPLLTSHETKCQSAKLTCLWSHGWVHYKATASAQVSWLWWSHFAWPHIVMRLLGYNIHSVSQSANNLLTHHQVITPYSYTIISLKILPFKNSKANQEKLIKD